MSDAELALESLATEHQLDLPVPEAVRREVDAWVADPGIDDPALDDLTELPFVTIDEPHSRDLDQALCLQRVREGFVAWYAIADAAHFVPPHSALFEDALRRGASYYLPGSVHPMLPVELSEGLVSLNPGVDRRALVFEMRLDPHGHCTSTRLRAARVHSRAKLDYDGVQAWLDGFASLPVRDADTLESLALLPVVGGLRLRDAESRDVVHYRRAEVALTLATGESARFVATTDPRNDVERFNEQLSLLCNVEGARFLAAADADDAAGVVEPIYRVHAPPGPERLRALEAQLEGIAAAHTLDPADWIWRADGSLPLSEFLSRLPHEGAAGRIARAIHRQAVLVNQRSVFDPEPSLHHGVGAPMYGRFSAPMREVVGVYLHQEVAQRRSGVQGGLPAGLDSAEHLRERVVAVANTARERQRQLDRDANRLVLDQLLADAQATERAFIGTVMGLSRGRIHVELDEPAVDVKVYLRHQGAPIELDERRCEALRDGEVWLRVGDAVRVTVHGRDDQSDRWALQASPADHAPAP